MTRQVVNLTVEIADLLLDRDLGQQSSNPEARNTIHSSVIVSYLSCVSGRRRTSSLASLSCSSEASSMEAIAFLAPPVARLSSSSLSWRAGYSGFWVFWIQKNHQECHDRGAGIDYELQRIAVVEVRPEESPNDYRQTCEQKRHGLA